MQIDDFDFDLPTHLIAQRPSESRGESRVLTVHPTQTPSISLLDSFSQIVDLFQGNEILVINQTKVIPARIYGTKSTGGRVEIFFLQLLELNHILALTRGKLKIGQTLKLPHQGRATLVERDQHGQAILALQGIKDFWSWLDQAGQIPLPPYIQREPDQQDQERYQTVYAQEAGAVAAPTAGLHFTQPILQAIQQKGVQICPLTLHVGAGTFMPIKTDQLDDHTLHFERYKIPQRTCDALDSNRPIIAVGTTVVRALESFALDPQATQTNLFIRSGFSFQIVDGLISNFHLPKSTLLMLVSAFAGHELTMQAYQYAIQSQLRFYSYGDSSVFRRPQGRWIS